MFRETSRLFQESQASWEKRHQETERATKEMAERAAIERSETERVLQIERAETERAFREVAESQKDTDRKIKEMSKNIERLGGRLGEFVEGLVAPACETLFAQCSIPVHSVSRRVHAKLPGGRNLEIDLLVDNTNVVVLVEVKSKLTVDDVRDHLTKLSQFKEFLPLYAHKKAIGAVAAMVIEENVCRFAISNGLFVIEQAGETLRMANDEQFQPRVW
ncbi:MAG: DUF3782 domain-containing protein [Magnetococcales bacterium]|nr:DUF3782 domain-containing protein [Magnetococcales bacterium]MBF0117058.1 DUF3782 domain-containing protein [Magnetococcales bacterium]